MSIVLLARALNVGGMERQLVELAKGLRARGHAVLVVAFYNEGLLLNDLRETGVRVALMGKRGRWDVMGFLARLVALLRRERPDALYSFLVEPNALAAVLKPFLPGTRVVWGVRASNVDFSRYAWFARLTFAATRWLAPAADLIIANSWAGAEYHRGVGYPTARVVVVPNGIDVRRYRPDTEAGRVMRATWGIGRDEIVVGNVARLDPMKDHGTFLEAAAILHRNQAVSRFVCVGDGPPRYRADLEARAKSLGLDEAIIWTGEIVDMPAAYNAFDVCCLSSAFGEGFPNVLGEAMACGLPCVATDVGDAARIVDTCGVVVPSRNPTLLAAGVVQALAAANPERTQACRQRINAEFSVMRMVDQTEQLLREQVGAVA